MPCAHCQSLDNLFDQKTAAQELKTYRNKGPGKTTRLLIESIKASAIDGLTLLDIGGGVGAIQHELLKAGVAQATGVDASLAYLNAVKEEAESQGHIERVSYHFGDFVDLEPDLDSAGIVTLDRVICCYPDMPGLIGSSAAKAERLYGLVFPRDAWWVKIGARLINAFFWIQRDSYRVFIHPTDSVETIIRSSGLTRRFYRQTFFWQIVLYERQYLAAIATQPNED